MTQSTPESGLDCAEFVRQRQTATLKAGAPDKRGVSDRSLPPRLDEMEPCTGSSPSSSLLSSPELSDTKVYEPSIRAHQAAQLPRILLVLGVNKRE